ncbi:hypothetical protein [Runella sp. SP2]|uniref:hypothetical protein n=1 Tax=Runella sp. SP2 TaxID=2268026 RepID=UPI000F07496A|nr:hypothetical protein [Runella sp. SP2]AYQ33842.1 hypothetical protein DTQ70_17520 [Runella sp. SP2]
MKPDKFDEAIRQKLEGIQPSFQEDDWSKFAAYQAAHTSQPFFQRFSARTAWYTAASVAAAMMVFANVYQYRTNKKLDHEVVELKATIAKQKDAPVRVTTRVDTVYITKYIEVKSSKLNTYDSSVPSLNDESPDETIGQEPTVAERLKNVGKIIRQSPNERISNAFERTPKQVDAVSDVSDEVESDVINKKGIEKEDVLQRENGVEPKPDLNSPRPSRKSEANANRGNRSQITSRESVSSKNSALVSQQSTRKNSSNTDTYQTSKVLSGESNEIRPESALSESESGAIALLEPHTEIEELAGIPPAEAKVKRYAYTKLSNPSNPATSTSAATTAASAAAPPPPSISFKNMKFRMGAGLNISNGSTTYTANTSLLLGKFWSINVGVARAFIVGPQYFTEDIFKEKTKSDFKDWNKKGSIQPPMAPPQAFNISTSATLWQLPVSLTYRWPMNDGFAFLLSGGTNFNLSACQSFSFYTRERNGELTQKRGDFVLKPTLSNDLIAAAGVEKQWRHLVVQAETYIAPYLQKPSYLTENRNLGIRFKVMYQFGKKAL